MSQTVTQIFKINSTWTAPAGVTNVTVSAVIPNQGFASAQTSIFNTSDAALLITPSGSAYGWGANPQGNLGNSTVIAASSPTLVISGVTFSTIGMSNAANGSFQSTFAITPAGALYSWGYNTTGQLGIGLTTAVSSPTAVVGNNVWSAVIPSNAYTFGLTNIGGLYAWGKNLDGQLGIGTSTSVSSPTAVLGSTLWKTVSTGDANFQTVLGLSATGAAYGWGDNTQGQLGIGNTTAAVSSPTLVIGGYTWQKVVVGRDSCTGHGLTTTGQIYSWGIGSSGELGNNTTTTAASSPTLVIGGHYFVDVFTTAWENNTTSVFGLTNTGALYAWGDNTYGQLGIGTSLAVSSPTLVLGGYTWQQTATMLNGNQLTNSVYALATSGAMYAWGGNANGELGTGTTTFVSSPTLIVGGYSWQKILGTGIGWCAALAGGNVYAWGYNIKGMLGNNTIIPTSSPVLVLAPTIGSFLDATPTVTVPVIPGATYPVIVEPTLASFSNYVIASGYVDRILLSYAI